MAKTFEYSGWGCDGGNQSPQLMWKEAPKGTKSFAITVYDPMRQQAVVFGIG